MVFVDTWAWLALAFRRDQHHVAVSAQHAAFRQQRRRYVTSDQVLSELVTQLYQLLSANQARAFVGAILQAADQGEYLLVHLSADQFRETWELRQRYDDKPDISFVDLSSMVIMQDLGVTDVFTGDAHFQQVNLGFRLFPK
jgi:predicted nucleic acid-binding protein